MIIAEFPAELIFEIASYLGFKDSNQTHLAMTCRHLYSVLFPGILEYRLQCMRFSPIRLLLSSYDDDNDGSSPKSFGGSYRMMQFNPGKEEKEFLFIQNIICRAKDLDAVHLHLGQRQTTLPILAAIINGCVVRPNLSLSISGTIPSKFHQEYEGPDYNGTGPFKFELHNIAQKNLIPVLAKDRERKGANMLIPLLKRFPFFTRCSPSTHKPSSQINLDPLHVILAVPRRPTIELSLAPQCQLSSLCIAGDVLFLPSFYPFTKNLLNTAKLTKLSLSHIRLNLFAWTEILPALTIPTLREFCIGKVSIAFPDLLKFLGRQCHQSIEVLDFTGNDPIGVVKISLLSILSRLTSLTASAEYLIPFLQSRTERNFPALQHLGISAPRAPLDHNKNELNPVYELILNTRPFTSIKVDNIGNSGIIEWITRTSQQWPTENPFSELKQFFFGNDDLSILIPEALLEVLVAWVGENIRNEDLPSPFFNSRIFARSNPKEALKQFIWYKFPNLRYLNTVERASDSIMF